MVIKEKQVKHFNCPMCKKPDLSNKDDTQEMYELIFVSMVSTALYVDNGRKGGEKGGGRKRDKERMCMCV